MDAIFLAHQHVKSFALCCRKKIHVDHVSRPSMLLAVYTCRKASLYIETATAHGKKCTKLSQLGMKIFPKNTKNIRD